MFLYIFKIIIKLIMTSSQFDPNSTSVRPQNPWTSPFYGSVNDSGLKILVLPTELNFIAKAHLASQQSHNSRAWGWKYGYKELSLSSSRPPSISSSGWLWVEILDLLCFYTFSTLFLLAFWFSLVKAPLAFVFYTLWILDLILHQ